VVTLGGFGGRVFEVAPHGRAKIGAPMALTVRPEEGEPAR